MTERGDSKGTWMRADRSPTGATTRLPPEIYADLVETLFGTVGSFLSGVFGGLIVPTVAWLRTGERHFLYCWAAIFCITLFRVAVLVAHKATPVDVRRSRSATWEALYAVGGVGFMWAIGLTAALLLHDRHDELTALYGIVSVLGCARKCSNEGLS